MSGINQGIAFTVTQLKTVFFDDLGNKKAGMGTGFWIRLKSGKEVFVTNRHNIDPSLLFSGDTKFKLLEFYLQLRRFEKNPETGNVHHFPETKFFQIKNAAIFALTDADCAIVVPQFENDISPFGILAMIEQANLADQRFFEEKLAMMDIASFIGFPGRKGIPWWDEGMHLPIARIANIASYPAIDFKNGAVKTSDITLVSGLSFSGSSGSLVISHEKSIGVELPLHNPRHVPATVIGIMSGHWWEEAATPDIFHHSGLSYFTRSTSIIHLIESNKL